MRVRVRAAALWVALVTAWAPAGHAQEAPVTEDGVTGRVVAAAAVGGVGHGVEVPAAASTGQEVAAGARKTPAVPVSWRDATRAGPTPVFRAPTERWIQEADTLADDGITFLGTAKWVSLAISAGAAVYGFSLNAQADDIFDRLDQLCLDDPDRCENRNPDGSFLEDDLEDLFQDTLSKDRQARTALLVSQVTLAASVVFFIMDLSNRPPENIPFDPAVALDVGPLPDGRLALGARIRLPLGGTP